ncbi:MAG: GYD domain-containing protein [Anaerolineae bacterium]|nr:GYD domain-containing protein [Anaerolineae bacterium]
MTTFVLLSKVSQAGVRDMKSLATLDRELDAQIKAQNLKVKRLASYALLGAYDFLHIFEAPDARTATKVALIANAFGVTTTQTLTAIPFEEFRELTEEMPQRSAQ